MLAFVLKISGLRFDVSPLHRIFSLKWGVLLLVLLAALPVLSQNIPKVYIAETEDAMASFLSASLLKKRAPLVLILDEGEADYILVPDNVKGNEGFFDRVVGIKRDTRQGTVRVINTSSSTIDFAVWAGDKTVFASNLRKGGLAKIADRLADQLIEGFFNGVSGTVIALEDAEKGSLEDMAFQSKLFIDVEDPKTGKEFFDELSQVQGLTVVNVQSEADIGLKLFSFPCTPAINTLNTLNDCFPAYGSQDNVRAIKSHLIVYQFIQLDNGKRSGRVRILWEKELISFVGFAANLNPARPLLFDFIREYRKLLGGRKTFVSSGD